jgi:hypothetical protein
MTPPSVIKRKITYNTQCHAFISSDHDLYLLSSSTITGSIEQLHFPLYIILIKVMIESYIKFINLLSNTLNLEIMKNKLKEFIIKK